MKTLNLFILLFLATGVYAQSLSMNDIKPAVGDSVFKVEFNTNMMSGGNIPNVPTGMGTGQTWNYSSQPLKTLVDTLIFNDTAGVVTNVSYSNAEFMVTSSRFTTEKYFYSYSTGFKYWGRDVAGAMPPTFTEYTDPEVYVTFPINSSSFDSVAYNGMYNGSTPYNINGSMRFDYMASGTLTVPSGVIYQNAILIKRTNFRSGIYDLDNYEWYVPGCPFPVMTITHAPGIVDPYGHFYTGVPNTLVNVNRIATEDINITVYPNPTIDNITLETEETVERISIITIGGQRVRTTNNTTFNIGDLNAGTYILEIQTAKGLAYKQIVKQ